MTWFDCEMPLRLPPRARWSLVQSANQVRDQGGATGIRTPDPLHAMNPQPSPSSALTQRDQPQQRHRPTRSDSGQRSHTLICYPDRYPEHGRSALPRGRTTPCPLAAPNDGSARVAHVPS
jgi:hypothetical protein